MEAIDKILDMMKAWPIYGQGIFLFLVFALSIGVIHGAMRCFVAFFRGWPPPKKDEEKDD